MSERALADEATWARRQETHERDAARRLRALDTPGPLTRGQRRLRDDPDRPTLIARHEELADQWRTLAEGAEERLATLREPALW